MLSLGNNIRPNLAGDYPKIDPSSLIDPSAQIIGNVEIAKDVFVGPLTIIRADQRGKDEKMSYIRIGEEVNIQDGVIIHGTPGSSVTIGAMTSIAHGVVIHGPCAVGHSCFLAIRSILYDANLDNNVWLGMGSLVMNTNIQSFSMIPVGKVIRSHSDAIDLRLVTDEEKEYMQGVMLANSSMRRDYIELRRKAESIKSSAEERNVKELK